MTGQPFFNNNYYIMTRSIIIMAAVAWVVAACSGNEAGQNAFATDSLKYEKKTNTAEVALAVDWPQNGNAPLVNAMREYVSEQLGGNYKGTLANADSVIQFYGQQQTARMEAFAKDLAGSAAPSTYYLQEIKVLAETETFVTYTDFSESFLGGAHGISSMSGVTFRKSDGRRFGQEMLRNTDTEAFRKLLKDGLKQYFSSASQDSIDDGQLAQLLLTDSSVDYLPLPQATPYLTKDGVDFVYQPYEIAPYAAGRPSFTVPYEKIKPFLIETILKLI